MTPAARGTLDPAMVGATVGPITHTIDARWLMAYAAGLGEEAQPYFDTLNATGPLAHPLFPVCYEWPAAVALRDKTVPADLQPQSVHATHHLTIHRAPRAGDTLHTTARVIELAPRRSGTLVVSRFETLDANGDRVSTTDYGSVYRDVALARQPTDGRQAEAVASAGGPPPGTPNPLVWVPGGGPPGGATAVAWQETIEIPANAAWVYTECAKIWNPIHTDVRVAKHAGLSAPILHGTATLALAVSRIVARELHGEAQRVHEIRVRFSGMVAMPSTVIVRGRGETDGGRAFDAVDPSGAPILSQGVVIP
jgi:acyl dehydratase